MHVDRRLLHGVFSPLNHLQPFREMPPSLRFVKINFEGSLINSSAAGRFIIRDWTRKLIKTGGTSYGQVSILVAEARALRDAVKIAAQADYNKIDIEGDNLIVIYALRWKF